MLIRRAVFSILFLLFGSGGVILGLLFLRLRDFPALVGIGIVCVLTALGLIAGVLLAPRLINGAVWIATKGEQYLQRMPVADLLAGVLGLIVGLIIANLFGTILSALGWVGKAIWLGATVLLGYLGFSIGVKKREEFWGMLASLPRLTRDKSGKESRVPVQVKVLDTSAIIDGRIADLCASGFIEGTLVIPIFILDELQHIADSNDILKRNRGRRGLDILNRIRKEAQVKVQVLENVQDLTDLAEVDAKLVQLAKRIGGKIVTTDFNLNKVAELQGVKVLNVNELANALRPIVLPGEEMVVHVVRDGKEAGQGVGYLDDGTMIVVDGGKKHIGQPVKVAVTSVLQTTAGRMIFAKPKTLREEAGQTKLDGVNAVG
ncbi:MAG: PIN/TRAM domain-containing protein [Ammonifex sp.]|nr:MAG: PIN/TRAM domain-containing protein [Ammonifex sp.]